MASLTQTVKTIFGYTPDNAGATPDEQTTGGLIDITPVEDVTDVGANNDGAADSTGADYILTPDANDELADVTTGAANAGELTTDAITGINPGETPATEEIITEIPDEQLTTEIITPAETVSPTEAAQTTTPADDTTAVVDPDISAQVNEKN